MELDNLRDIAKQHFSTEEEIDAFMDGFVKEAAMMDFMNYSLPSGANASHTIGSSLVSGITDSIAKSTGGLLVNSTVAGLGKLISQAADISQYRKFMEALNKAVSMNKILKGADKNKVHQYGETIFKFAPHVATDPNLLSSILANAIHGEGIDPVTIKTLTELEGRYKDNISFNPKSIV